MAHASENVRHHCVQVVRARVRLPCDGDNVGQRLLQRCLQRLHLHPLRREQLLDDCEHLRPIARELLL